MRRASALLLAALPVVTTVASAQATPAARDSVVYAIAAPSRLEVKTGKAGLFGFAGHEHVIRARGFTGHVVYFPGAPTTSRVEVRVATDSLEVMTPPDTAEIRKVTEAMRTDVLHVARYPEIRLVSKTVTPAAGGLHIVGALTMHGQTREVPFDVRVVIQTDTLHASARFEVMQSDFGMTPYRGGPGGTVRVADRVTFTIEAVAVSASRR